MGIPNPTSNAITHPRRSIMLACNPRYALASRRCSPTTRTWPNFFFYATKPSAAWVPPPSDFLPEPRNSKWNHSTRILLPESFNFSSEPGLPQIFELPNCRTAEHIAYGHIIDQNIESHREKWRFYQVHRDIIIILAFARMTAACELISTSIQFN